MCVYEWAFVWVVYFRLCVRVCASICTGACGCLYCRRHVAYSRTLAACMTRRLSRRRRGQRAQALGKETLISAGSGRQNLSVGTMWRHSRRCLNAVDNEYAKKDYNSCMCPWSNEDRRERTSGTMREWRGMAQRARTAWKGRRNPCLRMPVANAKEVVISLSCRFFLFVHAHR